MLTMGLEGLAKFLIIIRYLHINFMIMLLFVNNMLCDYFNRGHLIQEAIHIWMETKLPVSFFWSSIELSCAYIWIQ